MIELRPGTRLRSANSTTEVIVTMGAHGELTCGGELMVPAGNADAASAPAASGEDQQRTLLGKRYCAPDGPLQVLCVRQGSGAPAFDGVPLELMKPKLLPASD